MAVRVGAAAQEFLLKSLARKVADTRPPPVLKWNRLGLPSRKSKYEHWIIKSDAWNKYSTDLNVMAS